MDVAHHIVTKLTLLGLGDLIVDGTEVGLELVDLLPRHGSQAQLELRLGKPDPPTRGAATKDQMRRKMREEH